MTQSELQRQAVLQLIRIELRRQAEERRLEPRCECGAVSLKECVEMPECFCAGAAP